GKRRCIDDAERHIEHPRERLRKQRLSRSRRPYQKNVALLYLDIRLRAPSDHIDSLVMLIDGHGELLLGLILTYHVIIEKLFDLNGFGKRWAVCLRLLVGVVGNNFVANIYTLIADVYGGACNKLLDFVLCLSAKGAA